MAYAVVTREAEAYAAAFAAVGLEVVTMPVTRTEPPNDEGALARAIAAGGYAAIVCASARAAHALAVARGHTAIGEVWAVGPATAQALAAAGITAIVPEVRDGAGLARAIIAARSVAGTRILVPRAEEGRDDAIEILRAAGAEVDAIAAYRTVACDPDDPAIARGRELLERGAAAACAVFAPSQVAALARIVPLTAIATRFIAIGETTARALREAGVAVAAVAESPTPEGMARALAAVYSPVP